MLKSLKDLSVFYAFFMLICSWGADTFSAFEVKDKILECFMYISVVGLGVTLPKNSVKIVSSKLNHRTIWTEVKFPTEVVDLPSKGLLYPEDSPLSTAKIEIKYMTAKEEDILTSTILSNKVWLLRSY